MTSRFVRLDFLRQDIAAGVVVFLVALPLCLGISLASDAPMLSGVVTGIVAGLMVALLSGSELSVSGPAAGLTMTVVMGQQSIGSFEGFLVAVVLSGFFQIVLGLVRAGTLAALFPTSVIKGMLAGIGLIIIMKQLPHALGWNGSFDLEEGVFAAADRRGPLAALFAAHRFVSVGAVVVSGASMVLLVLWEAGATRGLRLFRRVPGPLAAVLLGIALNEYFRFFAPALLLTQEAQQLVALPAITGVKSLFAAMPTPDFSWLYRPQVWSVALSIAIIGSIETLLCLEATDKLDPLKRVSRPNRELVAQGVGNIVAGGLGGIPMTSVIVRSSANIYSGGRTRISAFVHGALLLLCVVEIPALLNLIPLASLAAILIVVGYKLANAALAVRMYKVGIDQFLPFMVTLIAVATSDLLTGVIIGTGVGLLVVVLMNYHAAYIVVNEGSHYLVRFAKDVSFIQKMKLKRDLARIPNGASVLIDGGGAMFIDYDILELVSDFKASADDRGIQLDVRNVRPSRLRLFSGGTGAADRTTGETPP